MHYPLDGHSVLPKQAHAPTPSFTHNMLCHNTSWRHSIPQRGIPGADSFSGCARPRPRPLQRPCRPPPRPPQPPDLSPAVRRALRAARASISALMPAMEQSRVTRDHCVTKALCSVAQAYAQHPENTSAPSAQREALTAKAKPSHTAATACMVTQGRQRGAPNHAGEAAAAPAHHGTAPPA